MNLRKYHLLALGFIVIGATYILTPNRDLNASVDNCLDKKWDIDYEWGLDYEQCACADEMNHEFQAEHLCE